jgi:hypothetical protein
VPSRAYQCATRGRHVDGSPSLFVDLPRVTIVTVTSCSAAEACISASGERFHHLVQDVITYSSLLRFVFICCTVSHIVTGTDSEAGSLLARTLLSPVLLLLQCATSAYRNPCLKNTLTDTAPSEIALELVWLSVLTSVGMWLRHLNNSN